MKVVIQRVSKASVSVDNKIIASIQQGVLILLGIEAQDTQVDIDWLSNIKSDTLSQKLKWHKEINFEIIKWMKYDKNDSLITVDINKKAFDFPEKNLQLF